jgi:hypothetical protein
LNKLALITEGEGTVTFHVVQGTTYQIAMDGEDGAQGEFSWSLLLSRSPSNDLFASRVDLGTAQDVIWGTTVNASREPGEPLPAGMAGGGSVWYRWTAPGSGTATFAFYGYNGTSTMGVYLGSSLTNLLLLAQAPNERGWAQVDFYAVEGTTYQIAISDVPGNEGDFGFLMTATPPIPPNLGPSSPRMTVGGYTLHLKGAKGQSFILQASTNLTTWVNVVIDTFLDDTLEYTDSDAAAFPQRFYRVLPLDSVFSSRVVQVAVAQPLSAGHFQVRVLGPSGQPFVLQTSTNLLEWSEVTRGFIYGGQFDRSESIAPADEKRFYRALPLK